ncbi:MAG: VacJ family lipoprotein [Pseudomonadota bacterium]
MTPNCRDGACSLPSKSLCSGGEFDDLRCPVRCAAILPLIAAASLAACSVPSDPTAVHDPYEPVNRVTHAANVELDRSLLRPSSQVYGTIVPGPVRRSVDNAAGNLGLPSAVLNKALQGNVEDAVHNFARFAVNSTLGVFGLFDPAQDFGLEARDTGFSDTLATWGAADGAYLVLPLFGPSTERDAVGGIVDAVTNPVSLVFPDLGDERFVAASGSTLNSRYEFTDTLDSVLYDSADSYVQLRLFYLDSARFGQGATDQVLEELYDGLIFDE